MAAVDVRPISCTRNREPAIAAPQLDVAAVYRKHGDFVLRRIRRFFGPEEAEDVLQEVFVRLLSTSSGWRGESALTTWLYQVATRHCLNRLRSSRRRQSMLEQMKTSEWALPSREPSQEATVFLNELWHGLDEQTALIGVYYFVDDMSHAAIADLLGCSRRTVGNRIARLQAIARARATEGGPDAPR